MLRACLKYKGLGADDSRRTQALSPYHPESDRFLYIHRSSTSPLKRGITQPYHL